MADSFTANYNLTKPEISGSRDTWGQKINDNLTTIDTQLKTNANAASSAQTTANAALPKSGGTMTGAITLSGAPSSNLHAATKKYVDDADAALSTSISSVSTVADAALPKAGGAISGSLTVGSDASVTGALSGNFVSDSKGDLRDVPLNLKTAAYSLVIGDAGKCVSITTGGVTVPSGVFSTGDVVTIFNDSTTSQTITQGTSVTLRQAATTNTGNRTLAGYGLATILCVASNTFVVTGNGIS